MDNFYVKLPSGSPVIITRQIQ